VAKTKPHVTDDLCQGDLTARESPAGENSYLWAPSAIAVRHFAFSQSSSAEGAADRYTGAGAEPHHGRPPLRSSSIAAPLRSVHPVYSGEAIESSDADRQYFVAGHIILPDRRPPAAAFPPATGHRQPPLFRRQPFLVSPVRTRWSTALLWREMRYGKDTGGIGRDKGMSFSDSRELSTRGEG
jgi:hypothetical protein